MIELAKKAIENRLKLGEMKIENIPENVPDDIKNKLGERRGVFVTIRKGNELRGCIGTFSEDELWIQVQRYAVFSALHDPRFEPLKEEELQQISVEISIIKDIEDVKDINEIKLGEDGVILDLKGKGGVLLPDVAHEFGIKTPEEFLNLLCKKINVPPGSWKNGKIKKFKVEKITE